uniref:Uncharacterized protein n=1 Tax=Coturnix japonica TaxID=93934 RepID=A0A8C2SSL1_COTJA
MAETTWTNELLTMRRTEVENAAGGDGGDAQPQEGVKGSYVSIKLRLQGLLLKRSCSVAIVDCGLRHECIPQPSWAMDVLCQASPAMGKTAVLCIGHIATARARHGGRWGLFGVFGGGLGSGGSWGVWGWGSWWVIGVWGY